MRRKNKVFSTKNNQVDYSTFFIKELIRENKQI